MTSRTRTNIPTPADPYERREPLPSPLTESAGGDPAAAARVRAILESPSYRVASEDIDFLASDLVRGLRFDAAARLGRLADSRAAEDDHGLENVAGSQEQFALEIIHLQPARADVLNGGGGGEDARRLAIAERVLDNSRYYDIARAFGRMVAEENARSGDGQTLIMTGGGPGIMEAANRGAFDAKAKTIGLNISLMREQFPNPYVSPELCFNFHYFAMRKLHFLQRAMALVAFPGGYRTLDELFEILTLSQTRKIRPMPIVLVGERYWRKAVNFDFLVEEGVIDAEDRELFWYAETAEDIWGGIQKWEREKRERYGSES